MSETCKSFDRDPANISYFPKHLQDVFERHLPRRLQDVLTICLFQDVLKTSSRRHLANTS